MAARRSWSSSEKDSTGAANDLATATGRATRMVREYGLSPELGPVGYPSGGPMCLPGGQELQSRPYAEAIQRVVDAEVARGHLDKLTELLLEHETIDGETVYRLVGRPVLQTETFRPGDADGLVPQSADL